MGDVFYSVRPAGAGTGNDLKTGSPTITIASGVATLSVAQTGDIGVGCAIDFGSPSTIVYISEFTDSTHFKVTTATGGTPADVSSAVSVNLIYHPFETISDAEAGSGTLLGFTDLVTNTTQLYWPIYGSTGVNEYVTFDYTGSDTYGICVFTPRGSEEKESVNNWRNSTGVWSTSYFIWNNTGSIGNILPHMKGIVLDGLQMVSTGNVFNVENSSVDSNFIVRNCLVRSSSPAAYSAALNLRIVNTGSARIENSIISGYNVTNARGIFTYNAAWTIDIYNCIITDCYTAIYRHTTGGATVSVRNCAVFNNTDDFSGTMTVTYTASDDNDIAGTGNIDISPGATEADDWAAAFTDYANGDFSLKSGSPLIDAGIGPALDSDVPTTDIVGNPRSGDTCCIGAFEYVESGGTVVQAECAETLVLSAAAGRSAVYRGVCSESMALSSASGPLSTLRATAADGVWFSDIAAVRAVLQGLASDLIAISDSAARSMRISVTVEESVALGDSASGQATLQAQAVDTLTLSEALAVTGIYLAAASELLAFSDAAVGTVTGGGVVQGDCMETIAFAAGASARLDALASALETMGLSGSASAILHAAASAVDNLAFSDAAAWGAMIQALAEEGLLFSDEASATMTMIGQAIEALAFSDGALPRMAFTVEAFEALSFRDAVAAIARFGAVCSETIGFFDMAVHFEPKGMVTITFESKKGSITFSLKKGTITFQ